MGKTTTVTLEDHVAEFVDAQVSTGRYADIDDVLNAGLRLLEAREQKVEALCAALAEGERSGVAGPYDIEKIKRRARKEAGLSSSDA